MEYFRYQKNHCINCSQTALIALFSRKSLSYVVKLVWLKQERMLENYLSCLSLLICIILVLLSIKRSNELPHTSPASPYKWFPQPNCSLFSKLVTLLTRFLLGWHVWHLIVKLISFTGHKCRQRFSFNRKLTASVAKLQFYHQVCYLTSKYLALLSRFLH